MNLIFGWFNLVGDTILETGIEINIDGIEKKNYYKAPSTFRFEDNTASKDADLSSLILSSGVIDTENEENSTYKEYELTPTFNMKTLNYELTLLEYIDTMDITVTPNDTKSTMKIKVPRKDEENNLIYEEKDISPNTPFEITLNKLGEPDTVVTVIVTAEDGKTINEYEIVIKRPFGTIRGQIQTAPTKKSTGKNEANVLVYKNTTTQEIFNWDEAITNFNKGGSYKDTINATLRGLKEEILLKTQDDGSYETKVIPGVYDILIDKEGYLDHIYIYVEIEKDETIDLGSKSLIAGDVDKNAKINNSDIVVMYQKNGTSEGNSNYSLKCDFDNNKKVNNSDIVVIYQNNSQKREIEDYRGR